MAVRTGKYGFMPVGTMDPRFLRKYTIAAAADIFIGSPVEPTSAGLIGLAAAANQDNLGVVLEIFDNTGMPQAFYDYSATTNTGWTALVCTDPDQVYQIHYVYTTQLSETYIWNNVDWVAGTGSESTGLSGAYIGAAPSAAQAGLTVVGIADLQGNSWSNAINGSNYEYELLVKFNEHINKAVWAGI